MTAIADSSPLILFSAIGRLDLLQTVFADLLVPATVWAEVVERGGIRPGALDLTHPAWIHRQEPLATATSPLPRMGLDPGETEAIALALRLPERTPIILDDLQARGVAERLGLFVTGSAGVLLAAKQRGAIGSVFPLLAELREAGLFLSEHFIRVVLDRAGESSP